MYKKSIPDEKGEDSVPYSPFCPSTLLADSEKSYAAPG
jgi:hypothetical protein